MATPAPSIIVDGISHEISSLPQLVQQLLQVLNKWQAELEKINLSQTIHQTAVTALQSDLIRQIKAHAAMTASTPPPIPEAVLNLMSSPASMSLPSDEGIDNLVPPSKALN